jgi:hypothetical protein
MHAYYKQLASSVYSPQNKVAIAEAEQRLKAAR